MSMRIVPTSSNPSTFAAGHAAPSVPGVHDTLRAGVGPSPLSSSHQTATKGTSISGLSAAASASTPLSSSTTPSSDLTSGHPLEARLKNWEATQEAMRMETLRRTFGSAEPVRRQMELRIARAGEWRPAALGGASGDMGVHEEILRGRDEFVTWEDVFTGGEGGAGGNAGASGMHEEMERMLRM